MSEGKCVECGKFREFCMFGSCSECFGKKYKCSSCGKPMNGPFDVSSIVWRILAYRTYDVHAICSHCQTVGYNAKKTVDSYNNRPSWYIGSLPKSS